MCFKCWIIIIIIIIIRIIYNRFPHRLQKRCLRNIKFCFIKYISVVLHKSYFLWGLIKFSHNTRLSIVWSVVNVMNIWLGINCLTIHRTVKTTCLLHQFPNFFQNIWTQNEKQIFFLKFFRVKVFIYLEHYHLK